MIRGSVIWTGPSWVILLVPQGHSRGSSQLAGQQELVDVGGVSWFGSALFHRLYHKVAEESSEAREGKPRALALLRPLLPSHLLRSQRPSPGPVWEGMAQGLTSTKP